MHVDIRRWPLIHSRIRHGSSVMPPKASRLKKLPQRPMACPMKKPATQQSASAQRLSCFFRQTSHAVKNAAMTAP